MLKLISIFLIIFSYLAIESKCFECGEVKVQNPNPLFSDNEAAKPGEWPWMVALFKRFKRDEYDEYKYLCGSTLISNKALVTAAHCLHNTPTSSIKAFLGKFNLTNEDEAYNVMRLISDKKVHKNYTHQRHMHQSYADIAVLIMNKPVEFTDYIQPICLPSGTEDVHAGYSTVVGYGKTSFSPQTSDIPHLAHMTSVPLLTCAMSHLGSIKVISEKSFCAIRHDGTPCKGDSGSGFYRFIKQKWTLLGIVTHGLCNQCDPKDYVVFVNVPLFVEWINENAETFVTVGGEITVRERCYSNTGCKNNHIFEINSSEVPNSPNYKLKSSLNNEVDWFQFKDQKSMKYLPLNTFEVFPNIELMDGDYSGIVKIFKSNFKNCKKLKLIWLYGNEIEEIEAGSFDDATELINLNLGLNKISSLDPALFHKMKKLKGLSLSNNGLTSLSVDAFIYLTELKEIYLLNNPVSSSINETLYLRMNKKLTKKRIN